MSRLTNIHLVRQEDPNGCAYACMAMLAGLTYREVREELGDPGSGSTHWLWNEWLAQRGFSYQFRYPYDATMKRRREVWPLPLWAGAHLCTVNAGRGDGTHVVVVLRDGTVLDPDKPEPQRWESYSGVEFMAGIFDVRAP